MILGGNEIYLYENIGSDDGGWEPGYIQPSQWIAELHSLASQRKITVRINSGGGSVFGGFAIFEAIRNFRKLGHTMTMMVDGCACSIASVIAMAGSPVKMSDNALLMIHRPMAGAGGHAGDLQKTIDVLDKAQERLVHIYAQKTGKSAKQINTWLENETWFSAEEALEAGFIDEIVTEKTSALDASLDVTGPENVMAKARAPVRALVDDVLRNIRNQRYDLVACDVERLTRKPGVKSVDWTIIEGAMSRAKPVRYEEAFDEFGYLVY